MFYFVLISVLFIIIIWIFLIIKFSKSRKLPENKRQFFEKNYKKIYWSSDTKHQIIDLDKLYHKLLLEIWHKWTFGEILKTKPREIGDLNKIWELHKLRNKLVHDFDLLEEVILTKRVKEYKREFEQLLKRVS